MRYVQVIISFMMDKHLSNLMCCRLQLLQCIIYVNGTPRALRKRLSVFAMHHLLEKLQIQQLRMD